MIHRYWKDGRYRDWRPPSRAYSADNLYTVHSSAGRDLSAEHNLKVIEDLFLKIRRSLLRGIEYPPSSKKILAWYVAAMHRRSPTSRDHWQGFMDRVVDLGDNMKAAMEAAPPEERRRIASVPTLGSGPKISLEDFRAAANQPFGQWLFQHIAIEAKLLEQMNLKLWKAPPELAFITSDHPVVWSDVRRLPGEAPNIGLGSKFIEVTMPIAPDFCAMFDNSGSDGFGQLEMQGLDVINSRTLAHCEESFIANTTDLMVDWIET